MFHATTKSTADKQQSGIVEASGCFAHVDRRANVPAAEARVVDEYYAHVQLPAFAQALCRQGSPLCPELLTKYTALDLMKAELAPAANGGRGIR